MNGTKVEQDQRFSQAPSMMASYIQPVQQSSDMLKPPPSKMWRVSRLLFSITSIIVAAALIGTAAGIAGYNMYGVQVSGLSYYFLFVGPQAIVAIIWDVAELITICARTGHRGIHPGAHVALHLLLWLGLAAGVSILALQISFDSVDFYGYSYRTSSIYRNYIGGLLALEEATAAMAGTLLLVHFVFFVLACIETSRYNNAMRGGPPVIVYMPPGQTSTTAAQAAGGYYYVPPNVAYQMGQQYTGQQYGGQQSAGQQHTGQQYMAPTAVPSQPASPAPVYK